jgi:EAL domain-containing protein (putative c-di-GMP-specific phosphodiesterase class I)
MDRTFAASARLRADGLATGRVAVNVTATQLLDPGFPADTRRLLQRHGLASTDLEIEVTESVMLDRGAARIAAVLGGLRTAGMTIALDDFGTGYASLLHLKRLPVDRIKIDRSFIAGLPDREEDLAIARAIISLARALGCETVAEGVETAAQMQTLARLGCDTVQGFYIGRPVPVGTFRKVTI